jgi:hypothetical protein
MSLAVRMAGIVWAPGKTFRAVAAFPRWFGVLAIVTVLSAALWFWFTGTEPGQLALLDQQERQAEAWGQTLSDEQRARTERMLPFMRFLVGGTQLVMIPLLTVAISGILFGAFSVLGGTASYRQVFAVTVHAG